MCSLVGGRRLLLGSRNGVDEAQIDAVEFRVFRNVALTLLLLRGIADIRLVVTATPINPMAEARSNRLDAVMPHTKFSQCCHFSEVIISDKNIA